MSISSLIPAGSIPSYTPHISSPSGSSAAAGLSQNISSDKPAVNAIPANQEGQHEKAVQAAAEAVKNAFPSKDVTFTIYKEAGQFVTRFTDQSNGKVTYYPEQTLFAYFRRLDNPTPVVNIKA